MRLAATLVLLAVVTAVFAGAGGSEPSADEQTLLAAGLTTDGPSLLEFFRARARPQEDGDKLLVLARGLGHPTAEIRTKAAAQLVASGPAAVPALRHVLNDLDDQAAADRALRCLDWIEGRRRSELPIAAAKLLAVRRPTGATEALVTYLPFADDASVVDGVKSALVTLTTAAGKPEPALVRALTDPVPLRRAVAVEVICGSGQPDALPDARKLLGDPKPQVRLRAALALIERQDAEAIGVLIDLLAELPTAQRRQIEDALQQLAGEWSPNPALAGDDEVSRKIRRDAWAAWWKNTDGPTLLAAFQKRTLSVEETDAVLLLIARLGDANFNLRERAAADLVALGPKVVPLLREATQSKDLERSKRAENCLKLIAQSDDRHKLPTAAARLLAMRNPPGATAALLGYLPFNDDDSMRGEIGVALQNLVKLNGKPEPVLVKALGDVLSIRRAVAAEVLASVSPEEHRNAVRKLLKDADPTVRLRVAVALTYAADRGAVPELIDLVAELPRGAAWQAEDLLFQLAGAKAPPGATGDDAPARKKFRDDWNAWWKEQGAQIDLAQLKAAPTTLGFTLIVEIHDNGNGRVIEVDRNGKSRWTVENLAFPVDAWLLPGNKILVAECNANRVTERDLKGTVLWQHNNVNGQPVNVQRLPNGNTFIAVFNSSLLEVDPQGKVVFNFPVPGGIHTACKTPSGQFLCLTNNGICLRLDATGKELKRIAVQRVANWTSGIGMTPKGNVLVSQCVDNMILEVDHDGKTVGQTRSVGNTSATRLANGHTLVASYEQRMVQEYNQAGKVVWEYRAPPGYHPFRARQR